MATTRETRQAGPRGARVSCRAPTASRGSPAFHLWRASPVVARKTPKCADSAADSPAWAASCCAWSDRRGTAALGIRVLLCMLRGDPASLPLCDERIRRYSNAAEDPDRVWVGGAASDRSLVDVGGPGIVVAAGVRERADRGSGSVVACPAEPRALGLAG